MQTFLPFPDFRRSAEVLDAPRLGKQRVETLQVLRAVTIDDYGWGNHPAVTMWRGRTEALVLYGLECVRAWVGRGHADTTADQIAEFAPGVRAGDQRRLADEGALPSWVGDERLHRSHRSALLRKDPAFYRPLLGDDPDDLEYHWPPADDLPATPLDGRPVWVVRPDDDATLGRFLSDGVVGLGAGSGLAVDVTGMDDAALRAALREHAPGRRPGKALRQLRALAGQVRPGDEVAVPVSGGTALLTGTVEGGYGFDPLVEPLHRVPVRWREVVDRAAARPHGALQDPRALFAVHLVQ
ncbi:MSMEG_6728 family protein [Thalassiella azotivora]